MRSPEGVVKNPLRNWFPRAGAEVPQATVLLRRWHRVSPGGRGGSLFPVLVQGGRFGFPGRARRFPVGEIHEAQWKGVGPSHSKRHWEGEVRCWMETEDRASAWAKLMSHRCGANCRRKQTPSRRSSCPSCGSRRLPQTITAGGRTRTLTQHGRDDVHLGTTAKRIERV